MIVSSFQNKIQLFALGGLAGIQAQLGDLLPVACSDVSLGTDPAAAYRVDEGSVHIFLDVGGVHAAGGQELQPHEGRGQILHSV